MAETKGYPVSEPRLRRHNSSILPADSLVYLAADVDPLLARCRAVLEEMLEYDYYPDGVKALLADLLPITKGDQ